MKAYVINLKKRPDRLKRFMDNIGNFLGDIELEIVEGVDGSEIDPYNDFYSKNVNPWNFKHLNDKGLRGVIGCCESHIVIYRKILSENLPYALIFEDDAFPEVENLKIEQFIKSIKIPKKFSVIYLNKFKKTPENKNNFNLELKNNARETTESYIISKDFAELLYNYCSTNIGAIDAHIDQCYHLNEEYQSYSTIDAMFYQYQRSDSDIR